MVVSKTNRGVGHDREQNGQRGGLVVIDTRLRVGRPSYARKRPSSNSETTRGQATSLPRLGREVVRPGTEKGVVVEWLAG